MSTVAVRRARKLLIERAASAMLEKLEDQDCRRTLQSFEATTAAVIRRDGRELVNFGSNNYLGLGIDPRVTEAASTAAVEMGTGTGASRLLCGTLPIHLSLEEEIARLKGTEAALVFSSGYLANIAAIQTLVELFPEGGKLPLLFDRLCHASIVDGAKLSGARWRTFAHNNMGSLRQRLNELGENANPAGPRALIITEGIFSMDGDISPLPEIMEIAEEANALVLLDDAHGTGTVGPNGRGTAELFEIDSSSLIHVGTLSKAIGGQGGFVAGSRSLCDFMLSRARAFLFDTALAPACVAAALEAVRVLNSDNQLAVRLQENVKFIRAELRARGVDVEDSPSPIIIVVVGDAARAVNASGALADCGYYVPAVRPPTVACGASRLRMTIMVAHTADQLRGVATAISQIVAASKMN